MIGYLAPGTNLIAATECGAPRWRGPDDVGGCVALRRTSVSYGRDDVGESRRSG